MKKPLTDWHLTGDCHKIVLKRKFHRKNCGKTTAEMEIQKGGGDWQGMEISGGELLKGPGPVGGSRTVEKYMLLEVKNLEIFSEDSR